MPLRYDYDIHWIGRPVHRSGEASFGGPENPASLPETRARYRARFRDPATVAALRQADPDLRSLFEASGFGLSRSSSDLPDLAFASDDLFARADIAERLAANLSGFVSKGKSTNGLCLNDFIAYEVAARPVNLAETSLPRRGIPTPGELARMLRARLRFPTVNPLALAILALLVLVLPRLFPAILHV